MPVAAPEYRPTKGDTATELIRATVRLDFATQGETETETEETARGSFNESFAALQDAAPAPQKTVAA